MKNLFKYITFLFLVLSLNFAFGQKGQLAKADAEFQLKNYARAVMLYQKVLDSGKENIEAGPIIKKIGECYKEMNQYKAATGFYENYINQHGANQEIKFNYAELLLKQGDIIKAKSVFEELLENSPGDEEIQRMVACCNFALSETEKANKPPIKNQELINSEQSEFGLGFFGDKLIFASQRLSDNYSTIHGRTNQGFSDLFSATFDPVNNMYNNPERLPGKINTTFNEGTFTYNSDLNTAYFTQCKKNPDLCRILKAKYEKDKWVDIETVSFGQDEYNFAHPSLSPDGKTMYFSSDLPGGLGGHDIWKVSVSETGILGTPEHMGNLVNTPRDEMFPLIIGDSILMFASEGHIGMGGLDIFYSKIVDGIYDRAVNVGAPINSTGDDFSILVNQDLNGGYFCSNRNNTQQSDDIFAFFHNIFLKDIHGKVVDSLTFNPIADVKITYLTDGEPEQIVYTDSLGKFSVPFTAHTECEHNHSLDFEKDGYLPKTVGVPCHTDKEMIVFLDDGSGRFHTLVGNILNKNTGLPVEGAKVTIKSLKGLNDSTFTDPSGRFSFDGVPADDYIILRASKENFLNDSKALRTPDGSDEVEMSRKTGYDTDFDLVPIEYEVEFDIENIYYEFDKARLLPESKISLNKLVNLLSENPGVKIQINSHTDERGTNAYNLDLSNRRGASVVNYLVAAGIPKTTLISRGFGETRLEIENATTEEEHQQNRRTTFEIIGTVTAPSSVVEKTYKFPNESTTKTDRDEQLFDRIREANKEGNNVSGESMLEFKIKAGMEDKPDKQVEVESGELLKIEKGEIKPATENTQPPTGTSEPESKPVEKELAPPPPPPVEKVIESPVYRIQIVATSTTIDVKSRYPEITDLVDKHGITIEKTRGLNKYQLGNFEERSQAEELKNMLDQRGFNDCFIVAVKK